MAEGKPPAPPAMPLWVKVFIGLGIVLVLVLVAVAAFGGGHGPGRHLPDGRPHDTSSPTTDTSHRAQTGTHGTPHSPPPAARSAG